VLIIAVLGGLVAIYLAGSVYLAAILRWEDRRTVGLSYYGLSPRERDRFKARLRFHARTLAPLIWFNGRFTRMKFPRSSFRHGGVSLPAGICDRHSAERAVSYQPRPEDVFVVTQMKCGTTWMQHVVYQVLQRGEGNLVESGTALYAVAPWLEGRKSVPPDQAPLVGWERPSRIIKSHLPAQLCPTSSNGETRYIYVARHPVSCFASCLDFVVTNVGAMAPRLPECEEWFRSADLMWWGTWTDHVKGWWDRAARDRGVLFLYFEGMKRDLAGVARRVAEFLGVTPLSDSELAQVVEKCGFAYMQKHQDNFEMHPPHILQTNAALFVRGTADRHRDVPEEVRERIRSWAAAELRGASFPLAQAYPDVAGA
jgi:hypothetical protein